MNTLSTRDKWLLAALPALVMLLLGWLIFLRPAAREVSQLRQRVENQGPLAARRALVIRAQEECAELEKAIASKRAARSESGALFDSQRALQQVSQLCAENGLSLDNTAPDKSPKLPLLLKDAAAGFDRAGKEPEIWRIEMRGAYADVVKLLGGLQQAKPLIVPLNLSMQTGKYERLPASWILTLWL